MTAAAAAPRLHYANGPADRPARVDLTLAITPSTLQLLTFLISDPLQKGQSLSLYGGAAIERYGAVAFEQRCRMSWGQVWARIQQGARFAWVNDDHGFPELREVSR